MLDIVPAIPWSFNTYEDKFLYKIIQYLLIMFYRKDLYKIEKKSINNEWNILKISHPPSIIIIRDTKQETPQWGNSGLYEDLTLMSLK